MKSDESKWDSKKFPSRRQPLIWMRRFIILPLEDYREEFSISKVKVLKRITSFGWSPIPEVLGNVLLVGESLMEQQRPAAVSVLVWLVNIDWARPQVTAVDWCKSSTDTRTGRRWKRCVCVSVTANRVACSKE